MEEISNFHILKRLCNMNKWAQLGDYWFEKRSSQEKTKVLFQVLYFAAVYALCIMELAEIILNMYPEELHGDALALGIAHITIICRFHCLQYNKKLVRKLNEEVAMDVEKFKIDDVKLLRRQSKKIRITVICQSVGITTAVSLWLVEGCRRYFQYNMPFVVLPIYWPLNGNITLTIFIHVFFFIVLSLLMVSMISADTLAASHLVMISYKLISLRHYFGKLEEKFESKLLSTLEMKKMTLDGVLEHRKLILLTDKVRECFGLMMSMQVMQGSAVIFLVLVKIAVSKDLKISAVILNVGFMMGLLFQMGMYLWNAGEVTHQASLIPDAIFHCGWHLRSVRDEGGRDLRRIVLMGCAQAQRPLVLKAFGIQPLSYTAYISILKMTYSIFAVLYP